MAKEKVSSPPKWLYLISGLFGASVVAAIIYADFSMLEGFSLIGWMALGLIGAISVKSFLVATEPFIKPKVHLTDKDLIFAVDQSDE